MYLLDDPLSAVDAHVGKHLFNECIVDKLLNSPARGEHDAPSVILVTNALQYLSHRRVTRIVVLDGGCVKEVGTFSELMGDTGGTFHKLLSSYQKTSSSSMDVSSRSSSPAPSSSSSSSSSPSPSPSPPPRAASAGTAASIDTSASLLDVVIDSPSSSPSSSASLKRALKRDSVKTAKSSSSSSSPPPTGIAQLMTDELKERESGSVSTSVYFSWMKAAGGYRVMASILATYGVTMFIEITARWWLSYWSEHGEGSQGKFLAIYALINSANVISMFLRQVMLYLSSIRASRVLFEKLLVSIMRAPMSFYDTTPIGRILNRFSKDMYTVDSQIPTTLRAYLGTLSAVIGTLMVISTVTPWFMACLVPVAMFYVHNQRFFVSTYRELRRLDSVSRSPIYALFGETLDGVATVRAYRAEGALKARIADLLDENQTAFFLTFVAQCWLAVRLELAGTAIITFACLCVVLQHSAQAGNETFAGAAGLSISFALSVTQSLNWSVRMASDLEAQMISVERVQQYCRVEPEAPRDMEGDNNLPPGFPKGAITFKNAEMRYRPGLPLVLKGLTLDIPAGSRCGVVGRTGAGKSSLMVVLMRLVELSGGAIMIDGVDISTLGLHLLRSKIAIVPQDPVLFSGTVKSNLDPFGNHSDARLWDVLGRVGMVGRGGRGG